MNNQLSLFGESKKEILLSLREEYYKKMLNGSKKYEYRTKYLKEETTAYIYISKTLKKIVAKIEFGMPIVGTAEQIATISERENPGSYDEMLQYMHNDIGYAIPIKKIIQLEEISLEDIKNIISGFAPPQSYYILDNKPELLNILKSQKEIEIYEEDSKYIKRNH